LHNNNDSSIYREGFGKDIEYFFKDKDMKEAECYGEVSEVERLNRS